MIGQPCGDTPVDMEERSFSLLYSAVCGVEVWVGRAEGENQEMVGVLFI